MSGDVPAQPIHLAAGSWVLLVSEYPFVADAFQRRGLHCHRIHPQELLQHHGKDGAVDMADYSLVWCTPADRNHGNQSKHLRARDREMATLIRHALRRGIPTVAFGTGSLAKKVPTLIPLVGDGVLKASRHEW